MNRLTVLSFACIFQSVSNHLSSAEERDLFMLPVITFILTFLPSFLLLLFFYKRDHNREPRKTLTLTLVYGGLTFIPVVIVESILISKNVFTNANPFLFNLYEMMVNVAAPEEFFKLLVVLFFCARSSAFDEPMDGMVYGAAAALGFATVENILYVIQGGLGTAIIRAILSVPSHAFWGAILGYTVGQVRFNGKKKSFILSGLLIAIFLHGLFNFLLVSIEGTADFTGAIAGFLILIMLGLLLVIFALEIVWVLRTTRRLRKEQMDSRASA